MKIEELRDDDDESLPSTTNAAQVETTKGTTAGKMWSIGRLYTKLNKNRNRRAINTPATTNAHSDEEFSSSEDDDEVKRVASPTASADNSQPLTKDETDRLRYMGILDEYLASRKTGGGSEEMLANEVETMWTKFERQKWKFKVVFFIVYTVFAIINFILVYNFYNFYALILQILNIAVTYSLLILSL